MARLAVAAAILTGCSTPAAPVQRVGHSVTTLSSTTTTTSGAVVTTWGSAVAAVLEPNSRPPSVPIERVETAGPASVIPPQEPGPATTTTSANLDTHNDRERILACIRRYEQGADGYRTDTGNGHAGAYQATRSTWADYWRRHGRADLARLNPAHASPADQDAFAWGLYGERGYKPWPPARRHCRGAV